MASNLFLLHTANTKIGTYNTIPTVKDLSIWKKEFVVKSNNFVANGPETNNRPIKENINSIHLIFNNMNKIPTLKSNKCTHDFI